MPKKDYNNPSRKKNEKYRCEERKKKKIQCEEVKKKKIRSSCEETKKEKRKEDWRWSNK